MIWKTTAILSAGMLTAAVMAPSSARAHAEDNALAFVIGAAVGHAISDHGSHVRKVHRRHPVHAPKARYGKPHYPHGRAYGHYKKAYHKGWHPARKYRGHEHRFERKHKRGHGKRYDKHYHSRGKYRSRY